MSTGDVLLVSSKLPFKKAVEDLFGKGGSAMVDIGRGCIVNCFQVAFIKEIKGSPVKIGPEKVTN